MAYAEVMFSTGNTPGFTDGMPIDVKGAGALVTPEELIAWFQSSTVPASVQALEPNIKARVKRAVLRLKYLSTPGRTAAEACTVRFGTSYTNGTAEEKAGYEALVQPEIDQAVLDRVVVFAEGYDTNWAPTQLREAGVIPVDLLRASIDDLVRRQIDTSRHPMEPRRRLRARRWRVPYEALASAQMVANLRNPAVRVDVQRQITPFTVAQIRQAL